MAHWRQDNEPWKPKPHSCMLKYLGLNKRVHKYLIDQSRVCFLHYVPTLYDPCFFRAKFEYMREKTTFYCNEASCSLEIWLSLFFRWNCVYISCRENKSDSREAGKQCVVVILRCATTYNPIEHSTIPKIWSKKIYIFELHKILLIDEFRGSEVVKNSARFVCTQSSMRRMLSRSSTS